MNLDAAKVGDMVAVYSGGGWYGNEIAKRAITRATATILVVDNFKYNRAGYIRGGGSWSRGRIELWDDEKHGRELTEFNEGLAVLRMAKYLSEIKWREWPIAKLEHIHDLAKELKEGK